MMETNPKMQYTLQMSDREFRIITLALASLAGKKIRLDGDDRKLAGELNVHMLTQRHQMMEQQLKVAESALKSARAKPVPQSTTKEERS
jgi:hypothetical protein